MLNVYKVMSENISSAIATNGESVTKQPLIRSMRTVKKETLKLISGWVSRSNDPAMVSTMEYSTTEKSVIFARWSGATIMYSVSFPVDDLTVERMTCIVKLDNFVVWNFSRSSHWVHQCKNIYM